MITRPSKSARRGSEPDLILATGDSSAVSVWLNQGNDTFAAPFVYEVGAAESSAVMALDLNGDGRLDLATVSGYFSGVTAVSVLFSRCAL